MRRHHSRALAVAVGLPLAGCTPLEKLAVSLGFGPPSVEPSEIHDPNGRTWDHEAFSELLFEVVDEEGYVDYAALKRDPSALDGYLADLAKLPYASLSRDAKLATLINAYNAFTLRLILDHYPVQSIRDIPSEKRWEDVRWQVGGQTLSLNQLEHEKLRKEFVEPRIHFAINCASVGCPPLARTAYEGDRIDTDLERAARRVHDPERRWFEIDLTGLGAVTVEVTRIYLWYPDDFPSVQKALARYHPPLRAALEADRPLDIQYLAYDWSLNDQAPVTE